MEDFFVARQAIVDANGEICGYELFFRGSAKASKANIQMEPHADFAVLANAISNIGQDALLGGKLAFINVVDGTLLSPLLDLLPPKTTILEIGGSTRVDEPLVARVASLRSQGFRFALDDCSFMEDKTPLFPFCDFVKIDCQRTGMLGFMAETERVRNHQDLASAKVIATKVETAAELEQIQLLSCEFFQGFFFDKPEVIRGNSFPPCLPALFSLVALIRTEAGPAELAEALSSDAASSIQLLRYLDSCGIALAGENLSLSSALSRLGIRKLSKWILLLLVSSGKGLDIALIQRALARGALVELLGRAALPDETPESLFLSGALSSIRTLLQEESDENAWTSRLSDSQMRAIFLDGPVGLACEFAEALAEENAPEIERLSQALAISSRLGIQACGAAKLWAVEFAR